MDSSTHHVIHIPIHYVEQNEEDNYKPEPIIKPAPTTITARIGRLISVTLALGKQQPINIKVSSGNQMPSFFTP